MIERNISCVNIINNLPIIFTVVWLLPLSPELSVTVQVCTPASRATKNSLLILELELLAAKQLLHVELQRYVTYPVVPDAIHDKVTAVAVR